jgi:sterol 24-C-methyltransferase
MMLPIGILTSSAAFLASTGAPTPSVEDYYSSLESRVGYWLLLGNTRHCGLYEKGQLSPFPISTAQRAMEEKLYTRLGLEAGSKVMDAGAGSGYVAMYMAI